MSSRALGLLVLVAIVGCGAEPSPVVPAPNPNPSAALSAAPPDRFVLPPDRPATTPLRAAYAGPARTRAGSADEIRITIENVGDKPETLSLFALAVPQLALDVFDAQGHVVPPMPPPMPPEQVETAALAPRASRTFTLTLQAFSPPLAPGRYSVRLRDERVHGAPLVFAVE